MANHGQSDKVASSAPEATLPLDQWLEAGMPGEHTVLLAADADLGEHYADLLQADAVIIEFPTFMDGRGFSIGSKLREQGFTGTLLAGGEVLSDQWEYLRRCGFSGFAASAAGGTPDFAGFTVSYQSR